MKTDKLFVLLLVMLLPLTGCIDVSDNANADDSTESEEEGIMTVINHYYNNTTTIQTFDQPQATSYHQLENQTINLSFDGTFTYKLETMYYYVPQSPIPGTLTGSVWDTTTGKSGVSLICSGGLAMDGFILRTGHYVPAIPNDSCELTIPNYQYEYVLVFSNHTLG